MPVLAMGEKTEISSNGNAKQWSRIQFAKTQMKTLYGFRSLFHGCLNSAKQSRGLRNWMGVKYCHRKIKPYDDSIENVFGNDTKIPSMINVNIAFAIDFGFHFLLHPLCCCIILYCICLSVTFERWIRVLSRQQTISWRFNESWN